MVVLKKTVWTTLKEYALISIGLLCYVMGWAVFLIPNNLIGGGVSGISAIIYYATGLSMGYSYLAINFLLLLLAFKIMGTGFGGKTIYAIIFTSVLLNVIPPLIPDTISQELAVSNGKMLSTIIGGVMAGFGIGMSISQGRLLLKLLDRELGRTSYYVIKNYRGGAAAGFWQGVAKLFGSDLKQPYDRYGEDRLIEELVLLYQQGQFNYLYYSIFWE